ncbi:glutathione S-transferase N-terminal domain-containing protein [Shewanella surugensis]|uniref:Glutathione S-transferase N-terminal domain-containing protein n=1 Tax=Shewanella surugensis TaxID=212020 RepID=A0ABT0L887_9GAMM|nr:glutathione S-transferase N-terminal domain-containing protein [Shewanella surugensis]MCL1123904.1 glutathione S-transferase N-terminal domain-containing protein [Shewanella surugensis]
MFMIRWLLGRIILLLNFIFTPKKRQRSTEEQQKIDDITQHFTLFEYKACPFCVKVRRAARRQGLNLKTLEAKQPEHKQTLLNEGGKVKVPCLRIEEANEVRWMYESSTIVEYLNSRCA